MKKKVKLFKSLLISTPIIVTPLLANSCDSKDNGDKPITATKINDNAKQLTPDSTLTPASAELTPSTTVNAKYYVDALGKTLKAALNSITNQVTAAAAGNNTLDITSVINAAKVEAKKIATFKSDNIDNITLTFTGANYLKVTKTQDNKYILTVYPPFINGSSKEQTLTTTLSLTLSAGDTNSQTINNTYNIAKGFKNYTELAGLLSDYVTSVYASSDGNTIYVGNSAGNNNGGLSVGTKKGDTYTFQNYTKKDGLAADWVRSVYASSDGNTIYVGTYMGVSVGTKQSSGRYTFQNYTTGLNDTRITSVYASPNGNTIYAGTNGGSSGGVSVGTKKGSRYTFQNYTDKDGLGDDRVNSVYASSDGSTIYVGTDDNYRDLGGVSVGTKKGSRYTFQNYKTGLGSDYVTSIYASPDGNTIYAGTSFGYGGVSVGTKTSSGYTFRNFTSGLGSNRVTSIYASPDGNTIYAGTKGGLSISTKKGSRYTFQNYKSGLGTLAVTSVYVSVDGNTIYAGTQDGLGISNKNWFVSNKIKLSLKNNNVAVSEKKY